MGKKTFKSLDLIEYVSVVILPCYVHSSLSLMSSLPCAEDLTLLVWSKWSLLQP
jgi:hypothetical protein